MRKLFAGVGKLIILARPKNPPLPLPDVCLTLWRKVALTREEISEAAKKARKSRLTVSRPREREGKRMKYAKNPPLNICFLSLPEVNIPFFQAEFSFAGFTVSVPITVPKFDWEAILFSGTIPVVKKSPKCTEKVITDFCKARPANICFEEKLSMFLLKTCDNSA
uniref:Uncharacterized protein n=1 Tax=Parascaris equorum TaxID=6256 RepID=A0A914RYN4_PAREQ